MTKIVAPARALILFGPCASRPLGLEPHGECASVSGVSEPIHDLADVFATTGRCPDAGPVDRRQVDHCADWKGRAATLRRGAVVTFTASPRAPQRNLAVQQEMPQTPRQAMSHGFVSGATNHATGVPR